MIRGRVSLEVWQDKKAPSAQRQSALHKGLNFDLDNNSLDYEG